MISIKKIVRFITNPHLLLCFGLAWIVTNGWAYVLFGIGTLLDIAWMTAVSGSYLTFVWVPFIPIKLITMAIALFLLRKLFPNDQNTLCILKELAEKCKPKKQRKIAKSKK